MTRPALHLPLATLCALEFALAVGLPGGALAASHAAKVIYAIGEVSVADTAGSRRAVRKGDLVAPGETVSAGKGRAQIKMTDGAFVALSPQTDYVIEDYSYDAATPSSGRSWFNLLKGGVRMITGAVARNNRSGWRMRTAVATIGIRGSGGYFRYVGDALRVTVDFGGFTATDPVTGLESDLGPGEYLCNSPCDAVTGAGDRPEDLTYFRVPEDPTYESGEDRGGSGGPIAAGPAPDGTHMTFATSFIYESCCAFSVLHATVNGDVTDGMLVTATFGSLENLSIESPPDPPITFVRNGANDIADPTGPGGATFNTELSAEWGRVLAGHTFDDPSFNNINEQSFTWVATTDETDPMDLPQPGSGVGTYDQIVGGSFPVHVFDQNAGATPGTVTPVIDTGTQQIMVKVFDTGKIDLFQIDGTFPSATLQLVNNDGLTDFSNGKIFFDPSQSTVTTGETACVSGCQIFGGADFGFAAAAGIGMTGAWHANTSGALIPPHAFNSSFVLQRSSLQPYVAP